MKKFDNWDRWYCKNGQPAKIRSKPTGLSTTILKLSELEKTLYWYSRFGRIEVVEQLFTQGKGKGIERPFSETAQVHCRGYSLPLQRIITDFGADVPFGRIPGKLQEHHGISVPVSSAQAIT